MSFIDVIPLWLLSPLVGGLILLSIELGWRLGRRWKRLTPDSENTPINGAVGATLGLLAFLLAFTFGMATTRFDTRRSVVLQEANAIGTAYLRTGFLPPALQEDARQALRQYLTLRVGGAATIMSEAGQAAAATLHDRLWAITEAAVAQADTATAAVSVGQFTASVNDLIDLDETRVTANRNRIPETVWLMLGALIILSMGGVGYQFGLTGQRNWPIAILLVVGFATAVLLVADLDRAQTGLVQVSQQPLIDLLVKLGLPLP